MARAVRDTFPQPHLLPLGRHFGFLVSLAFHLVCTIKAVGINDKFPSSLQILCKIEYLFPVSMTADR
jgi:hypothetical protein